MRFTIMTMLAAITGAVLVVVSIGIILVAQFYGTQNPTTVIAVRTAPLNMGVTVETTPTIRLIDLERRVESLFYSPLEHTRYFSMTAAADHSTAIILTGHAETTGGGNQSTHGIHLYDLAEDRITTIYQEETDRFLPIIRGQVFEISFRTGTNDFTFRAPGDGTIYAYHAGKLQRIVTPDSEGRLLILNEQDLSWSPDGEKVYYFRDEHLNVVDLVAGSRWQVALPNFRYSEATLNWLNSDLLLLNMIQDIQPLRIIDYRAGTVEPIAPDIEGNFVQIKRQCDEIWIAYNDSEDSVNLKVYNFTTGEHWNIDDQLSLRVFTPLPDCERFILTTENGTYLSTRFDEGEQIFDRALFPIVQGDIIRFITSASEIFEVSLEEERATPVKVDEIATEFFVFSITDDFLTYTDDRGVLMTKRIGDDMTIPLYRVGTNTSGFNNFSRQR